MKKVILYTVLAMAISNFGCTSSNGSEDCKDDVKDPRGKKQPWEKGAWETGKYRNVFREAGYNQ